MERSWGPSQDPFRGTQGPGPGCLMATRCSRAWLRNHSSRLKTESTSQEVLPRSILLLSICPVSPYLTIPSEGPFCFPGNASADPSFLSFFPLLVITASTQTWRVDFWPPFSPLPWAPAHSIWSGSGIPLQEGAQSGGWFNRTLQQVWPLRRSWEPKIFQIPWFWFLIPLWLALPSLWMFKGALWTALRPYLGPI